MLKTDFKYLQGAINFVLRADFVCSMMSKDVHTEAMRYATSAREFLSKAGKEGAYYRDPMYVKITGKTWFWAN